MINFQQFSQISSLSIVRFMLTSPDQSINFIYPESVLHVVPDVLNLSQLLYSLPDKLKKTRSFGSFKKHLLNHFLFEEMSG